MTTMREIVEDAFEEIGVKKAEVSLTGDELQSGIRRCNDMLSEWSDIGILPAYEPVLNGDDTVAIERNAIGAVKYKLAIRLAPSFQKPIPQSLMMIANESMSRLEASNMVINVAFPDTLPIGSGNECQPNGNGYLDNRFFTENKMDNF